MKATISVIDMTRRRAMNRLRWRIVLVLLLLAVVSGVPVAQAESGVSKEYQVKAAFLFNFVQFIEWPAAAFEEPTTPISIGILGDDPFGPYLNQLVRDEAVKSRRLIVKWSRMVDDLKGCQVVFISKSEKARFSQILARLEGKSVLTVSEVEGFAERGGIISFFLEKNRVRFEINAEAARQGGLKIDSQLLSLARIVGPETGREKE